MRRPPNFLKSPPYFCLQYIQTKVRWRFRKILWPSQNIWTLTTIFSLHSCESFVKYPTKRFEKNFNLLCFPLFGNEQRLDKKISSNEQYFHDFLLIIVKKIRCIFQAMTHTMTSHFLKAYPQGTFIWDFSQAKWVWIFSDGASLFLVHLIINLGT